MGNLMFAFKLVVLRHTLSRIVREANMYVKSFNCYTYHVNVEGKYKFAKTLNELLIVVSSMLNNS